MAYYSPHNNNPIFQSALRGPQPRKSEDRDRLNAIIAQIAARQQQGPGAGGVPATANTATGLPPPGMDPNAQQPAPSSGIVPPPPAALDPNAPQPGMSSPLVPPPDIGSTIGTHDPAKPGGMFSGIKNFFAGPGADTGVRGFLGGHANQLSALGAGLLSGSTPQEGFANAFGAMPQASALDRQNRDDRSVKKAMAGIENDPSMMGLPPAMRDLAKADPAFGKALYLQMQKPTDNPASYDEWRLAGGEKNGSYSDFLDRKAKNSATQVNMAGDKKYEQTVGEAFGKKYVALQDAADQAYQTQGKLDVLDKALSNPDLYQGYGGTAVNQAKKFAQGAFGMDFSETADADVAQAVSNEMTMQLRNPSGGAGMPGAMSDADRNFLAQIPPSLEGTPEGNQQKLEMLRKVNERNIQVADFANQYVQNNPSHQLDEGFSQALSEWSKANPLFPEAEELYQRQQEEGSTTVNGRRVRRATY